MGRLEKKYHNGGRKGKKRLNGKGEKTLSKRPALLKQKKY